jgi:hypothetical protein
MTLEAAFRDLRLDCHHLYEAVLGLRLAIVEDKPLAGDVVLVDELSDAADDVLGWLEEARGVITAGQQAAGAVHTVERTRQALITCHAQVNRAQHRFSTDLAAYERVAALLHLGNERGGEWLAWAQSVHEALERCQQPLHDVQQALLLCWQEMVERMGTLGVALQEFLTSQTGGPLPASQERQPASAIGGPGLVTGPIPPVRKGRQRKTV